MFGYHEVQFLRRKTLARLQGRSDKPLPLRSEHFPLQTRGREIVTEAGVLVATATDPSISEEIARRLNNSDWSDQEDQWAL
jgi:hypothetical protein